ncbi:MAG: SDR family NAD(P)-dependent oxidoreductase [Gammaproteobacteria bacterium]
MKGKSKVAIVGIACRFPGGIQSLDDYWDVLRDGRDVVTEVPDNRWSKDVYGHPVRKAAGRSYTWAAGVLPEVDGFDAAFFGISPREAAQIDPQQRILLELTWEALEDGGFRADKLAGTNCGVFIGFASNEYAQRRMDDLASIDPYTMLGNTASIGSNRISYIFDFRGPSLSVDTACSSSLVAFHLACRALHNKEASMAVVGGVNMLLHPFGFVGFSKASMLSPHGRCRAFDASGDGYVRAEGAAILLLKPLAQAEADGDRIYATVLSSGINCDGRTSSIAVPSRQVQAELLTTVYKQAGIDVNDLDYVEAHGTGTTVGDPLETGALGDAIGRRRKKNHPLPIGSVKTNLGHLEVASGAAGLIKTVLCLKNRALPPSLHFQTPNPDIDFSGWNLKVVEKLTPLPQKTQPLMMGVNSFGFGGANAHVLLEEYRGNNAEVPGNVERRVNAYNSDTVGESGVFPPLFLSARKEEALRELADQFAQLLELQALNYYDVAWTAVHYRQPLEKGAAFFAANQTELVEALRNFADGDSVPNLALADKMPECGDVALVYSGNGSQWLGMGCVLFKEDEQFRQTVQQVDAIWRQHSDFSLVDELFAAHEKGRLHLTEVAQPVLFAFQVAVTEMLLHSGLRPAAVFGHSVGEVAAAWASGALTLEQAVQVVHERSFAQAETQGRGRMAAVSLTPDAIAAQLTALGIAEQVTVAAVNSPKAVTVSGDLAALTILQNAMVEQNIFFRLLDLDYAFHSPYMDAIERRIHTQLRGLKPRCADNSRYISTVSGKELRGNELHGAYWWHNIRQPVRFRQAVDTAIDQGVRIFVEVGPHPVLCRYIQECLQEQKVSGQAVALFKRDEEAASAVFKAAYQTFLLGSRPDKEILFPQPGRFVHLPGYPWQREKYWYPHSEDAYGIVERRKDNPMLGYRLKIAPTTWENALDSQSMPWLGDHQVGGVAVLPAAGYVEMALAASQSWLGGETFEIEELEIATPIVLDEIKVLHFNIAAAEKTFTIQLRNHQGANVSGRLIGAPLHKRPPHIDVDALLHQAPKTVSGAEHYRCAEAVGLSYGPAFQGVEKVWVWPKQRFAWGRIVVPEAIRHDWERYLLHPALLDSCFQLLVDVFGDAIVQQRMEALIPVKIGKLRLYKIQAKVAWCRVKIVKQSPRSVVAGFDLFDSDGHVVATLEACRFKRAVLVHGDAHEPATYVFHGKLLPHADASAAAPLPDSARLVEHIAMHLETTHAARQKHFQEVLPLIDVLCAAYCLEALQSLSGGRTTIVLDDLYTSAGIAEAQSGMLHYILSVLHEEALLIQEGEGRWSFAEQAELPAAREIWRTLLDDYPEYLAELTLLANCGSHLEAVLGGKADAQQILAAGKSSALEHWYNASPSWRVANAAVIAAVREIITQWPAGKRLKILTVVPSQFALLRMLLAVLPAEICDVVLIDADENVVARAEGLFADVDFLHCHVLNIEALPENLPENLAAGDFDVAIVSGLLHGSCQLDAVLHNLRKLLANRGLLLAQERDRDRFTNLIFGADPHWWLHHAEDSASGSPLMNSRGWRQMLSSHGFNESEAVVEPLAVHGEGSFVLLAKNIEPEEVLIHRRKPETWLILADADGAGAQFAEEVAAELRANGQRAVLLRNGSALQTGGDAYVIDLADGDNIAGLLQEIGDFRHIVHLQGLPHAEPTRAVSNRCCSVMTLLHALERMAASRLSLWLITSGGAVQSDRADAQPLDPMEAAFWGVGRVAINEYPDYRFKLIDLPPHGANAERARMLLSEFMHESREDEVVLRQNGRYALRMRQMQLPAGMTRAAEPADMVLDFSAPGSLHNLYWRALPAVAGELAADQIQIRPCVVGLNFRDVMYAMGMLSDEALENGFAGAALGLELSGVVERVGDGVTEFKPGDEVISFAPASFATRVVTTTTATALKPATWSHAEGATVPAVFFTVYYALQHLARLQPGERILIHGAAGGVGLAAIQYAQYVGAEIFATAGSEEKRTLLRMMGVEHVMDSRSLAFADEVMALTHGEGIDVVLNSLAGEAVWRNLAILRPFGRFLELGKRDFYENSKLGLRPFRNNISYFGIDADQLLIERKALAAQLFREMMVLFERRVLRPLPYRVFDAEEVTDAFRIMQQSRQIGKVLVSLADAQASELAARQAAAVPEWRLDPQGSYLVSGGLSGLGLKTAQWLAAKGAKHLVLLGRSGISRSEAVAALQVLRSEGVVVHAEALDITDQRQLAELFAKFGNTIPPLKGIVHAAAIIDDALIRQMDRERFLRVFMPKAQGAWNLHRLSESQPLDFFVVYSSMTTFLGNPGQANYVAANSYLEALADYRRAQGLPALFVALGAIDDVGFLTRHQTVKELLTARLGTQAMSSDMALHMLEKMLVSGVTGAAVIDIDWRTLQRFLPSAMAPKYEEQQRKAARAKTDQDYGPDLRAMLASLSDEEALQTVMQLLAQEVAQILRLPEDKIDREKSVFDLGMDSLMGMELVTAIENRFALRLPLMALAEGASIKRIAERMIEQVRGGDEHETEHQPQQMIAALASRHESELSSETVEKLVRGIKVEAAGEDA